MVGLSLSWRVMDLFITTVLNCRYLYGRTKILISSCFFYFITVRHRHWAQIGRGEMIPLPASAIVKSWFIIVVTLWQISGCSVKLNRPCYLHGPWRQASTIRTGTWHTSRNSILLIRLYCNRQPWAEGNNGKPMKLMAGVSWLIQQRATPNVKDVCLEGKREWVCGWVKHLTLWFMLPLDELPCPHTFSLGWMMTCTLMWIRAASQYVTHEPKKVSSKAHILEHECWLGLSNSWSVAQVVVLVFLPADPKLSKPFSSPPFPPTAWNSFC